VSFAVANPALFRLMFGGTGHSPANNSALMVAGAAAYAVLHDAIAEVLAAEGRGPEELPIVSLTAWSLVHGIAKLILEAAVSPITYGVKTAEDLAKLMLARLSPRGLLAY
jgi:Tetracyclin repressor-like, C-terminal domain